MCLSQRLCIGTEPVWPLSPEQRTALEKIRMQYANGTYVLEESPCPCGESDDLTIAKRDRYGLPATTKLCRSCGLMRTSPRFTAETTRKFYDEDYRSLYTTRADIQPFFIRQMQKGVAIMKGSAALLERVHTVYDIGCGAGGILAVFAKLGKLTAGCDFDTDYLEFGRSQGLTLVEGDATALLDAMGKPADLVLLTHVFEHFGDLRRELEKVLDAVKPGGFVLITVPTIENIPKHYDADILKYLQNAHTYYFSEITLSHMLESIGLLVHCISDHDTALVQRPVDWKPGTARPPHTPPGSFERIYSLLHTMEEKTLKKIDEK